MTGKIFTKEQLDEITDRILKNYLQALSNGKMSMLEYTLVENVIIKINVGLYEAPVKKRSFRKNSMKNEDNQYKKDVKS